MGIPYQTLNYWTKTGLVSPTVAAARGSGSRRVYDFQDLVAIRIALKLRRARMFGKALIPILERMRRVGFTSSAAAAISIAPNGEIAVAITGGELMNVNSPGRAQVIVDFTSVCREAISETKVLVANEFTGSASDPSF